MAKGKSLADFRAKHDKSIIVPAKIKAALDAMAKEGADNWEYESDFTRRASISQGELGTYRDQFKDHVVMVGGRNPKRVWVATVKAAKQFSEISGALSL